MPRGRLLIGGAWRHAEGGATMPTTDPTTEEVVTQVAKASPADADAAVRAASEAFENGPWSKMHHEQRAKLLFRMADLMDERAEEFALREAMDMGMPYRDFLTTIMPHCSGLFRFFGGLAMQMNGSYRASYEPNVRILTRREPLGVVAMITPWNFPLALTCSKVAPALAAGNTVVHKPASDTPLTALLLAQTAMDAGLPPGVYNLVTGPGGAIGDTLVKHPLVEKIAFTGSTSVGPESGPRGRRDDEAPDDGTRRQVAQYCVRRRQPRCRRAGRVLGYLLEQGRGLRRRQPPPRACYVLCSSSGASLRSMSPAKATQCQPASTSLVRS